MALRTVDIRPGVSVLAVLRHLNYRPWHALAEFVDNSIQSYRQNRSELEILHGPDYRLKVSVDVDPGSEPRITIRDNAAGIAEAEYGRAFRPAAIPPDTSGLAEFGMGMKSAACWFAPRWRVRTSALGEPIARTIEFDVANIVNDDVEELIIHESSELPDHHYTEIVLLDVFHLPVGRTIGKLKDHLTDIYRDFLRQNVLQLQFRGQDLHYSEPRVLKTQYYKDSDGPVRVWRKNIEFDLGDGLSVRGFAAIRSTADTAKAGFSLFRRGRVIQGSADEGYRPTHIFGRTNSYRYQRLFGELHLEGFDVSHTKDGFRWDDNEQPFLELLKEHLDSDELPLLRQAEGYRVRGRPSALRVAARQAVQNTSVALERGIAEVMPAISDAGPAETASELPPIESTLASRSFEFVFRDRRWRIDVEATDDPAQTDWLTVVHIGEAVEQLRKLHIRISMVHPFMVRFAQADPEDVEALLRVAAALAVAEVVARDSGASMAGTVRRNLNSILRDALARP